MHPDRFERNREAESIASGSCARLVKTGLLYQNLVDTDTVAAIDLTSRSLLSEWPLAPCNKPTGMAIDSQNRRLFTVCAGNAKLVVFD